MDCSRKEKGKKERQGGGGRKEAVNTKKKLELEEGDVGVKGRFMGDVYYYTALPRGGEGRGVERKKQNIPFPFLSSCPYRSHTGWRALSPEEGEGVFLDRNAPSS